jgi:hypothetical protein
MEEEKRWGRGRSERRRAGRAGYETLMCRATAHGAAGPSAVPPVVAPHWPMRDPPCRRGSDCRATANGAARSRATPRAMALQKRVSPRKFFRRWFIIWIRFEFGLFLSKLPPPSGGEPFPLFYVGVLCLLLKEYEEKDTLPGRPTPC